MHQIYGICVFCDGSGNNIIDGGQATCPRCSGTGRQFLAEVDLSKLDDVLDKCNDILDKCNDILEQVTE